ncbi:MAG: DEAD/DEAH box helicase, partial [Planctomycetota bacterium]|nr:DEAD/DEAH box helicase [Planctomycetota bacterium]
PAPPNGDAEAYGKYLQARATGTANTQGRPVLWPSAFEYVNECIHGDKRHAVVSMPTGSGKSFIGELAVSQAVTDGWALYLAPTNALTEQIRGDLRTGLRVLGTEVLAFIGDQEYSIFANDSVSMMEPNSVAVMTPEKCALALRLSPEAFENCRLVVFDECHLIGDTGSSRGPVAELVLSHLMLRAPDCRFLLMSAIIQNPQDLAGWLEESAGGTAGAVSIRWRPTRTLRAVLGVEYRGFHRNATAAKRELESLREGRKNVRFDTPCALAAGLQGAWQTEDQPDYVVTTIDCDASLGVSRKKNRDGSWKYSPNTDKWVNATATALARRFAERGIQTLVFTPASKHYPFSNGDKVDLPDQVLEELPGSPDIVDYCRILAEFELGCDSHVFSLLDHGVAVHTALMLETEKIASESTFRNRSAPIMFATGTLAQGLNLPAIAVVIAGSKIGDPRGEDPQVVQRRRFSQLLNAAGRAGRAGFANQGIVIAVPDNAVAFRNFDSVISARKQADYLQQSDDSVQVESGLMDFMDAICNSSLQTDRANDLELEVISLLAGGDENQLGAKSVLQRTFAAYIRKHAGLADITDGHAAALGEMRKAFVEDTSAPEWLTIAAQRAGLDFFLTLAILRSWGRIRPKIDFDVQSWSVEDWLDEFLRLVVQIPPGLLSRHLTQNRLAKMSPEFKNLAKRRGDLSWERSLDWVPIAEWQSAWQSSRPLLTAWMTGKSIAEIASLITGNDVDSINPIRNEGGKPIAKALALTNDSWSALSLIAGGFLSVAEQLFEGEVPMSLASLPMCIKYGCDTPGTLGWFRFGVRLRRPAHLLANRFTPPPLSSDEELKDWVRGQRRDWLQGDIDEVPEFAAIHGFLSQ